MQPCRALSRWTHHGKAAGEFVIQASRVRCIGQSVTGLIVTAPNLPDDCGVVPAERRAGPALIAEK